MTALLQTDCPTLKLLARGKVRDIYEVEEDKSGLLFVATDRVSAFDVIMKTGIPNKGKLLTQLSLFFFDYLSKAPETKHIPNHVITSKIEEMPTQVQKYRDQLEGRSIWVRRATVLPVEAIVRGYITGSAWAEYQKTGTMHDIQLPEGLKESSKFDPPLFTPSTKAEVGDKDINIHPNELPKHLPDPALAEPLQQYALALYSTAAAHSLSRGLILADTKFEFGLLPPSTPDGKPVLALVDECLTPDSSRFWPAEQWAEGNKMVGFDKQFLREWLKSGGGGFGKKGGGIEEDPVEIPQDIVQATWSKYEEAFEKLTGRKFVA
ncbi:Phosphoribosylaminoimidazole-succinocarboxamide synthase [Rhodotorula toruloides ATCC 204091]|uniref:Phosphoribosylaminoimidazole-succinocarboxamide synthase n=1 Tax=Rhodotorula toruloides TaxID=5286 RepID=A0A0K3C8G2_RHOTO|nr:Phosphoribosylaminoimidazole-succinocarboxamide synthase [Rhodotorula toruloides ATCC 204091]PRQ78152.1 Phosphoribosylaminoimidazole-succinocarboxamide synthase [Rhodotorula toruloides]